MLTESGKKYAEQDNRQHFKALKSAYEIVLQDYRQQAKINGDLSSWIALSKRFSHLKQKISDDEQTDRSEQTAVN